MNGSARDHDDDELDLQLKAVLAHTYDDRVDVETAAAHLWSIHRAATETAPAEPEPAPSAEKRPSGSRMRTLTGTLAAAMLLVSVSVGVLAGGTFGQNDPAQQFADNAQQVLAVDVELRNPVVHDGAGEPVTADVPDRADSSGEESSTTAPEHGLAELTSRLPGR